MNSKDKLKEITMDVKSIEEEAEEFYTEIINNLKDAEIIEKIKKIRDDERNHIGICQKIIEIIES